MTHEEIKQIASAYGQKCSFEKLIKNGTTEHNGLRYENIIPWSSDKDEWVTQKTRVTGSTIKVLEQCEVRNFKFESEN
jgi:hypothetical protein